MSFTRKPRPAPYISSARAMSLRHPPTARGSGKASFSLTGHGGQLNKRNSAVGEKGVEWLLVGHLAVSAPQHDADASHPRESRYPENRRAIKEP